MASSRLGSDIRLLYADDVLHDSFRVDGNYFYKFLTGEFQAGMDAEAAGAVFSNLLADPLQMSFWMILTVILGIFCV